MSASTGSTTGKNQPSKNLSLFVLIYRTRRVLVASPERYDHLQLSIRQYFPEIPADHRVSYHTNNLRICEGVLTEISPDTWGTVIPLLNSVTVLSEAQAESSTSAGKQSVRKFLDDSSCDEADRQPQAKKRRQDIVVPTPAPPRVIPFPFKRKEAWTLNAIRSDTGEKITISCHSSNSVGDILNMVKAKMGFDSVHQFRAMSEDGKNLESWDEADFISDVGIRNGGEIDIRPLQVGGKPVIYLFPPSGKEIDASVKLSLVPEWHLSAIYPVVPVDTLNAGGQALLWNVKASSDGTLLEKSTGLEVAYLFWEAEAVAPAAEERVSPVTSPVEMFIPNQARVEPANSVVLEVAEVTPYLDSALKALGLHVEARTSFITYWLPSFLKHGYVALRFLHQSLYEKAAPLEVSPVPDVIVRVFMLFKGLKEEDLSPGGEWKKAETNSALEWKIVVRVDQSLSLDDGSLFRVVEWGGMELFS